MVTIGEATSLLDAKLKPIQDSVSALENQVSSKKRPKPDYLLDEKDEKGGKNAACLIIGCVVGLLLLGLSMGLLYWKFFMPEPAPQFPPPPQFMPPPPQQFPPGYNPFRQPQSTYQPPPEVFSEDVDGDLGVDMTFDFAKSGLINSGISDVGVKQSSSCCSACREKNIAADAFVYSGLLRLCYCLARRTDKNYGKIKTINGTSGSVPEPEAGICVSNHMRPQMTSTTRAPPPSKPAYPIYPGTEPGPGYQRPGFTSSRPDVGFSRCVKKWCFQNETLSQYTNCKEARDGGDTCLDPTIKYGTTEGGIPHTHFLNDYNAWCKQIFGEELSGSITTGPRDCSHPKGKLFWCSRYDESRPHWCDWDNGRWKSGSLDQHSGCSKAITSLTCR